MRVRQTNATTFDAGFTLLELMVVLAIVGAVSAMVLPRLAAPSERMALKAIAMQLGHQIRATRLAAVRTSSVQTVTIDSATRRYWSSVDPAPRVLPQRMRLVADGACLERTATGEQILQFRPDGSACDATIVVSDGGRSGRIAVDWLTGTANLAWSRP
jgi:general secretion pathway protein H